MDRFDELRVSDDCCSDASPKFSCRMESAAEQSALLYPRHNDPDSYEDRIWVAQIPQILKVGWGINLILQLICFILNILRN